MKCNKHSPDDYTSSIGVCASCLRERLLTILVAQQHLQLQQPESIHHHHSIKSETKQPIPFQFPQSVSPYISRQNTHHHHHHNSNINNTQRFHFTPQVVVGSTKNKGGGGGWKLTSMLIGLFGGSKKKSKPDSDDWKQTPPKRNHHNNNNLSVFCLSPLVRPGPNRRIVTTMPSFCKNRSRKLADIGRCNYNSNY